MTQISVFIASSIDGYIATNDDNLDWLTSAGDPTEDYGYDDFIATVDAVAMGRGTYNYIAGIDPHPYGDRPLYVFTHVPPPSRSGVIFWDHSPADAISVWRAAGYRRVYIDGGNLISSFLDEGLVDDMLLTTVPLLLGSGRPLFHPVSRTTPMRLVGMRSWPSGMVNRSYERA